VEGGGRARWTPRDYAALAREGYARNAIVYRAVRLIAESLGALSFVLYEGTAERDSHPLLDLVRRPNPRQDGASLLEAIASHLLLAGNAYIEAVGLGGEGEAHVRELYALRPDRMKLLPGPNGWPQAYEYAVGGSTVRFDQNAALPPILHLTLFNLNSARPSGALVYAGADGAMLSAVQYERLKKEFADFYQGANNAGRPLVLDGGLDWRPMSLSPRDMDFLEAKHAAAREIALAFGVPPMLLGIPGDNTYSNYQEANRVFWRQSVLPLAGRIGCALTHWLAPVFGEGRTDKIEALSTDRAALWERVSKASFLSVNEKRLAAGYGPIEGGDVFQQPQ
jgi:phage portal protein BeeE